jgi:cell division protein FtsB
VVLFLYVFPLLFGPEKGQQPEKAKHMRKRNYLKTDRSFRMVRNKKLLIAAGVLLALYLLTSFIFGEMGVVKYCRMKAQYTTLTEETALLKRDNTKLRKTVYSLKNDPVYVERIARDKLGLARPGEIVYYYINPDQKIINNQIPITK